MTLRFWQGWPHGNRIFFLLFSVIFTVAIANMWVAYFVQPAPAIELKTYSEADISEVPVDQFSKGPFDFNIRGNNYVIIERQLGSMLSASETVAYSYLAVLAVFVIGMLAVISTLGRFYYLVGMGIFIVFVTTLSPELLGVLGSYGKLFTIFIMALYGLASFWLFYFATTTSFAIRVAVFGAITLLLWIVIYFLSFVPKPFLVLASYSAEAGLIACALFAITVGHEIIAAFVSATTQSPKQTKSLNHFLIISVIYLINLALTYSVRFRFIKWDIITVDVFLLLTISGILGIWGIRQRRGTYSGIIDADPYAVFAFLLVGAFTFSTIGMFMYNGNDTALSAISDIVIFTHIGFGFIFLTYVLSNFGGMLSQNMQVHKVLYSPKTMPVFTFRFAGLITAVALMIYNAWQVPVHNAMSGFYNALGDLHLSVDDKQIAQAYYERSRTYGFRGHHANYALANLEGGLTNTTEENKYYHDASANRPTQMSVLNWAQTYQATGNNMEAIVALREGIKKLKNHEALENTLGILYARVGMPDSASKYLSGPASRSNLVALVAMGLIPVTDTIPPGRDIVMKTNILALDNRFNRVSKVDFEFPSDTVLTLAQAASLSNYLINTRNNEDTTFVRRVLTVARKPANSGFKEALLLASSIALYNSGETREAFTTLEEVTVESDHKGKYNNILTMWALDNDEPQRAAGYSDYAVSQDYAPAKLTHAVALTEAGKLDEALIAWDSLRSGKDSIASALAANMRDVLTTRSVAALGDKDKYSYTRYRLSIADSLRIFELVRGVEDDNIKARILVDLARKCYAADKPGATLNVLQRIVGLELTDAKIGEQMQLLELLARVQTGSSQVVTEAMKENPIGFKGKTKKYKVYFDAVAAEAAGDSTNAGKYYHWLGTTNPFFEDGLIAAANYFVNKGLTSYTMLTEGLLYHPSSMRLKKAYALEAARKRFDDYAKRTLTELKPVISTEDYKQLEREIDSLLTNEN